jgi:hypothetical protein
MPESLWEIFWLNRDLLNIISGVAAEIIQEIAKKKNAVSGIFTALHTFGRDLKRNVHIHLSVTCGGLNDKNSWVNLFFPAAPIKKMWRHRIIELFRTEYKCQNLALTPAYSTKARFDSWMKKLYETQWYVHLQKPSDNHKRNIEYLGRYIKRPPISEARIDEYDGEQVTFKFLDHYNGTTEYIKMSVLNFIARLIRHIPDRNFKMIRYYGFLSNRTRGKKLPLVYKAIKQVAPKIIKAVTWRRMLILRLNKDPLACPNCNILLSLRQVYYGLSPPLLTLHIDHMINDSEQVTFRKP